MAKENEEETQYACNGCGFETTVISDRPCPGCGHDTKPIYRKLGVSEAEEDTTDEPPEAGPKLHKHSYRKDGTCACGQVRRKR